MNVFARDHSQTRIELIFCFVAKAKKKDMSQRTLPLNTGRPKINETHKIANKYVDFNPIVYIFQI